MRCDLKVESKKWKAIWCCVQSSEGFSPLVIYISSGQHDGSVNWIALWHRQQPTPPSCECLRTSEICLLLCISNWRAHQELLEITHCNSLCRVFYVTEDVHFISALFFKRFKSNLPSGKELQFFKQHNPFPFYLWWLGIPGDEVSYWLR